MRVIKTIDKLSLGIMLIGAVSSLAGGVRQLTDGADPDSKDKPQINPLAGVLYGGLAIATIYRIGRMLAPKTKEEQRLERVTELYDKADGLSRRALLYRKAAETSLKHQIDHVKAATHKMTNNGPKHPS
jgi:hypothetical protein